MMASNNKPSRSPKKKQPTGASPVYKLFMLLGLLTAIFTIIIVVTQNFLDIEDDFESPNDESNPMLNDLVSATKPFGGDKFSVDQIFEPPIWGTLNGGHYFGLKLSSQDSVETSLMWFQNRLNSQGSLDIRHLCSQNDRLDFYGWLRHDFHSFGDQIIQDQGYQIRTKYLKNHENPSEWYVDVEIDSYIETSVPLKPLSLIQYITTNHIDDEIDIEHHHNKLKSGNQDENRLFIVRGKSKDIGDFEVDMEFESGSDKLVFASFLRGKIDKNRLPVSTYIHSRMTTSIVNGTRIFNFPRLKDSSYYDETRGDDANIVACQIVVKPPCSFSVKLRKLPNSKYLTRVEFASEFEQKVQQFDADFKQKFNLISIEKHNLTNESLERLVKVCLSNMLGSISYFHGLSFVGTGTESSKIVAYGPIHLLTGVPSRSFFPRGFLWDEAFHNLIISKWNPQLSNLIIKSWFNIMNTHGWIPREVILGIESMRRVPREFIVQYISNANPPAMFIVIEQMLDQSVLDQSTLNHIYPRLKQWYLWFEKTQHGPKNATFRWRGRDELTVSMLNPKTLTSGLDDYPRASHPSPHEYHIDLRCWLALAVRVLKKIAIRLGDNEYSSEISQQVDQLTDIDLLNKLHWSSEHRMYCDFGHDTEKVELIKVTKTKIVQPGDRVETYQVYERHSSGSPKFGCVPEFGYVSLFPMLFGLLKPNSEQLGVILDRLRNENELWSPYGIRSLSKASRYYNKYNTEHDKPYWRGAIWINLNYLILSSLHSYSQLDGPYRDQCGKIYVELRDNLVANVLREFLRTNYIWEQYDDISGEGKGSHPFTGWSSLILLIASTNQIQ